MSQTHFHNQHLLLLLKTVQLSTVKSFTKLNSSIFSKLFNKGNLVYMTLSHKKVDWTIQTKTKSGTSVATQPCININASWFVGDLIAFRPGFSSLIVNNVEWSWFVNFYYPHNFWESITAVFLSALELMHWCNSSYVCMYLSHSEDRHLKFIG